MSDATIYNWLKQERIDRGEVAGLSTEEALDLAAARAPYYRHIPVPGTAQTDDFEGSLLGSKFFCRMI